MYARKNRKNLYCVLKVFIKIKLKFKYQKIFFCSQQCIVHPAEKCNVDRLMAFTKKCIAEAVACVKSVALLATATGLLLNGRE